MEYQAIEHFDCDHILKTNTNQLISSTRTTQNQAFSVNHFSDINRSPIPEKVASNLKRHRSLNSVREEGRSRAVLM